MCEISLEVKSKKKTGYKVLVEKGGKFYSSFTGQEICKGKVPDAPDGCLVPLSDHWNSDVRQTPLHQCIFYRATFAGKTSAFIHQVHAKSLADDMLLGMNTGYRVVIAKVTFSGEVYPGKYGASDIIAGSYIKDIKVYKYFN